MNFFTDRIAKRVHEMRITESERTEALISLQHAEQFAEVLIQIAFFLQWVPEQITNAFALGLRWAVRAVGLRMRHPPR